MVVLTLLLQNHLGNHLENPSAQMDPPDSMRISGGGGQTLKLSSRFLGDYSVLPSLGTGAPAQRFSHLSVPLDHLVTWKMQPLIH